LMIAPEPISPLQLLFFSSECRIKSKIELFIKVKVHTAS
jgi:hypothetical protein